MEIKNVVPKDELNKRLSKLKTDNWKIKSIASTLGNTAKEVIDNWQLPSRESFLKMMNLKENEDYKFVYHNIK